MKTLKTTIIILLIGLGNSAFASSYGNTNTKTIEKEIKATLKKIDIAKYDIEEESAVITFTLNSKNEIDVQNIETESKELDAAIREKLDGMLSKSGLSIKTNYSIKISFVVLQ